MFSHIFIGVSDFERAMRFYRPLMDVLQLDLRFCESERPWAGWQQAGVSRPLFLVGMPFEGTHHSGNGQMTAFLAETRATVDAAYQAALAHGGSSEGAPGLRPEYHAHYYGAYFRDPEGNKLCVACHTALPPHSAV